MLLLGLLMFGGKGRAESVEVTLDQRLTIDEAGPALRQAFNAWEDASRSPIPQTWAQVSLSPGDSITLGRDLFVLLPAQPYSPDGMELMVVDANGPHRSILTTANEAVLGALRVLLISERGPDGRATIMLRATQPAPLLLDITSPTRSPVRITGFESPSRIVIDAPDPAALEFSRIFIREMNFGAGAEEAAAAAWKAAPPPVNPEWSTVSGSPTNPRGPYTDPVNIFDDPGADGWIAATVTLRMVRGEESAVKHLHGAVAYDSSGNTPDDPRITASGGGRGGTATFGSPGDRWQAAIHAAEAYGSVHVESESLIRVSLGEDASFTFNGPTGGVSGYVHARLIGRDTVELTIDQAGGDWTFLGAVSTRVRIRNGRTLPLAKSTYSRTESYSSGTPIVSGIPWIGPAIGSSGSSSTGSCYALYATVELD